MIKKITLFLLFSINFMVFGQLPEDEYNAFSSRSFMKFNSFLTVPTFSFLHRDNNTIEAISRSSNIQFEDAARLHLLSYGGKMRDNVGAGIAVFQQEINVFKDFGAIANYAYQIKLNTKTDLIFGFNFMYSRRSLDESKVRTQLPDLITSNYQDKPVVVFQPAITVVYDKFYGGIFLENLGDFNLKSSEFVTGFGDKTISVHGGYATDFKNMSGLLEGTNLKLFGVARRSRINGFSYAGNALVNLPKAGWIKAGYDNLFGLNAGIGVNLSERLSIGFSYEKQKNLGGTNEVGLIYTLGKVKRRATKNEDGKSPRVEVILPGNTPEPVIERKNEENRTPVQNDLSDEIRIAQDSINRLNKKVDEVLELLKNQKQNAPIIIRDTVRIQSETKDTSLRRRTDTPWRNSTVTRTGGGGTAYYVAINQFKSLKKVKDLVKLSKRKKVNAKYLKDPNSPWYYVYIDKFSKEKDADRMVSDINGDGTKNFEDDEANDLGIKVKSVTRNPVYVVKISFGGSGDTYKEPKKQRPAKIRTMSLEGVEPGYYIQVSVNGKKSYADRFVDELRADNINADYFINPKTGYRHVYIYKTTDKQEVIDAYNSNLDGSYYDTKNIIRIR